MRAFIDGGWAPVFTAALLFLACSPLPARAQAWVQKADSYYFKVSASYLFTREELNEDGDRQDLFADRPEVTGAWFRDATLNAYLEYGLSPRLTLVANLPFRVLTTREWEPAGPGVPAREITRTNGGLADVLLSLRTPIIQGPFAAALQAGLKLPLGYEQRPDNQGPPLGSGEVDAEANLFAGASLYPAPAYVGAGVGYRLRGGALHDEITFSAEAGGFAGALFFKVRFDGLRSTHTPPDLADASVVVGDQDVYKLIPVVSYRLGEAFALSGEVYHTLSGKDTVAGTAYALAAVFTR